MRRLLVVSFLILGTLTVSVQEVRASGPTTNPVTSVAQDGATVTGTVTTSTLNAIIYAVAVSKSGNFTEPVYAYSGSCDPATNVVLTRHQIAGSVGVQSVSVNLSTMNASCTFQPSTTYHVRIGVQDPMGNSCLYDVSCYVWGNTESFTTRSALLPEATTLEATEIGSDSAMLEASVRATDRSASVSFEYGTSPTLADARVVSVGDVHPYVQPTQGMPPGPASIAPRKGISGLDESTVHYFRVKASSIYGTTYGGIMSFRTKAPVGVSINDADDYTNSPKVELGLSWPIGATGVLVANDGGFRTQVRFALAETIDWTLNTSGSERLPKNVYVKFILADGSRSAAMSDDIILDTSAPVTTSASASSVTNATNGVIVASLGAARSGLGGVRLTVKGTDSNSGVAAFDVKRSSRGKVTRLGTVRRKAVTRTWTIKGSSRALWVRTVDAAGNASKTWKKVAVR